MAKSDKPDYVLVYDGEGGVRMAPAGTQGDAPPEGQIQWPSEPEPALNLETRAAPPRRRPAYVLPVVGAACLCVLGLGLGYAARPRLAAISAPAPGPMQPAAQQAASAGQMQVTVAPSTPAPLAATLSPTARLEVLPPDLRQGPRTLVAVASAPRAASVSPAAADPPSNAIADASAVEPADDCAGARTAAEAMVCGDPDLARADRRLARAFRAAIRSGAPIDQLRAEQQDWLEIREDAAERSPRAVAQIYEQRIAELEDIAAAGEPR
jgi:uncharacterized protein YecT (DUF1311 family)